MLVTTAFLVLLSHVKQYMFKLWRSYHLRELKRNCNDGNCQLMVVCDGVNSLFAEKTMIHRYAELQCCGSGSGIRCFFDPKGSGILIKFFPDPDPGSFLHEIKIR
jgi:hypothetical protein